MIDDTLPSAMLTLIMLVSLDTYNKPEIIAKIPIKKSIGEYDTG